MKSALNIIGSNIRKIRAYKGLTQEQVAVKCQVLGFDLTRGTLAKIESGVRSVSDHEIPYLARALEANIEDLFPTELIPVHREPRFKGSRDQ